MHVSDSGQLEDQFYHTRRSSQAIGVLKQRQLARKKRSSIVANRKSLSDEEMFSDNEILRSGYLIKQGSYWRTWKKVGEIDAALSIRPSYVVALFYPPK